MMGGLLKDLLKVRQTRKSLLHLTLLTSIIATTAFKRVNGQESSSSSFSEQDSDELMDIQRPAAISFCDESYERTIGRRLLYVSTLDGRLTALDITKNGKLHWSISTGPGPLISSSIHRLELTNNGQFVRMIPSLSGGIYKFDGESIDPIPITTENLLSSSAKFSDDLVISGGKETRTYGVSARTGQLLYECSMHGCVNATNDTPPQQPSVLDKPQFQEVHETNDDEFKQGDKYKKSSSSAINQQQHDPLMDDVILIRRQTQTVRAVESRTGLERWNFSVGQHELDLLPSSECHDRQFSDLDMAILDLEIKVVVPDGIICAFSKSNPNVMLWKYKFDHPIVSAWKIGVSDNLENIDMFSSAQWLWTEQDDHIFETQPPSMSPSIYLGMYQKQLYIQESITLRKEIIDQSRNLYTHLTVGDSNMPQIPWRPIPASSNSLGIIQSENIIKDPSGQLKLPSEGHELVPYDEDNFAVAAQSVLNASEYVNGNGFYLYTAEDFTANNKEPLCDKELPAIEAPTSETENTNDSSNHTNVIDDLGFSLDDLDAPVKVVILSLWFWWKEIVVIAFTSAILLNFIMGQRMRPREIVVIERHVPIAMEATESSTAALLGPTTTGSTTLTGNGSQSQNGRTLSESTSHSGEHFQSRFLNDFDFERCLGKGGFGVVFEAKNKLDDCKYAVKRITLPNKKESRERVMREVKTLANCEHQNIVRYFQAWVETPPPGWQEDEDSKWLAHELSTSIQIETPDGTTLPSFADNTPANCKPKNRLLIDKKQQLLSWMSSVASTACSSDHECDDEPGKVGALNDVNEEDEDSYIQFRSESQSKSFKENVSWDDETSSESDANTNSNIYKMNIKAHKIKSDAISIDIHSNSFDLNLERELPKNIDYSQLSDSFQIEFVRSTNGEADEEVDIDKDISKRDNCRRRHRPKSLQLSSEHNNNNSSGKALVALTKLNGTPPPPFMPRQNKVYLYIQMQLCRKESLRDWLRENRLEARETHIATIFHQIVDAVDYVHLKGLIHRDLKPSNIFFSQDGQIKIGDFGLVTDMSDIPNMVTKCGDKSGLPSCSRHTQQVGTHLYMSPEQLRGQHYDFKVDIYSLGLILFELLVFFGTEMERIKTLRDLRDGRYPTQFPIQHVDEYELLQLMLSGKPEERPPTPELKQRLNTLMKLPELIGDGVEAAALAAAVRRLSRSRTFSTSE